MSDPTGPVDRADLPSGNDPDATRAMPVAGGQSDPTVFLPAPDRTQVYEAVPATAATPAAVTETERVIERGGPAGPPPGVGRGWLVALGVLAVLLVLVVVALATGVFKQDNPSTPASTTSTTSASTTSSPTVTQPRTSTTQAVTSTTGEATTTSASTTTTTATSTTSTTGTSTTGLSTTTTGVSTTLSLP